VCATYQSSNSATKTAPATDDSTSDEARVEFILENASTGFDTKFVKDMETKLLAGNTLTERQEAGLGNIYFAMKKRVKKNRR